MRLTTERDWPGASSLTRERFRMFLITAIVKPFKLSDVMAELANTGISGLTVSEVKGFGRQKGHTEVYRGTEYEVDFVPKVKLEILAGGSQKDDIVKTIAASAKSGSIGDGKVWVTEVESAMRIRTGELGEDAL